MTGTEKINRIALFSKQADLVDEAKKAFGTSAGVDLVAFDKRVDEIQGELHNADARVAIIDMDATNLEEIEALRSLIQRLEGRIPVIVITQEFNAVAVRVLVQMQVADFLEKPVSTTDIVRSCIRVLKGGDAQAAQSEAKIHTFMPVSGGVGSTTLAIQTASILHNEANMESSTCIVDLNFQHGAVAEYLDLEPRFDISQIENNPGRLDKQLFEVMLSHTLDGIAVLAAPVSPTEMRSFDTDVVVRVLDLAAAYFDNVIIDLPRTWFPWTETVVLGSNKLYLVAEKTVPCLRQAQRLIAAIDGVAGKEAAPRVIVNRYVAKGSKSGIQESDIGEVLGEHFAGGVANEYFLVNEAIDRGVMLKEIKPDCSVLADLKNILFPESADKAKAKKGLFAMPKFLKKAG